MKVLIISYIFPPCSTAAGTVMYNLCKYLPEGYCNIITTDSELCIRKGTYDKEYVLNCDIVRLPVRGFGTCDRFKFFLLTVFEGLLMNKKEKIDCLFAVFPFFCDLMGAYVLQKLIRKPLVIHMHDLFLEKTRDAHAYRFWGFLEEKIFSSASKILVTNEKFRDHYLKRGIRNVVVFPSPIDLNETNYNLVSEKIRFLQGKLKIMFTGSVNEFNEDAVLVFLEAIERVSNVEVIFATAARQDYLKEVSIGFLSKKKCMELQRNADVLFLPLSLKSRFADEIKCAFPCKVLEYLAAGKPILAVVPKESFMADFIKEHEVGIVVTEASPEKIRDAIEEFRDEEKRKKFSQNAMEIVKLFDAKILSKRLCYLLDSVTSLTDHSC